MSEDVFVSFDNILVYDETEDVIQQHIMTTWKKSLEQGLSSMFVNVFQSTS